MKLTTIFITVAAVTLLAAAAFAHGGFGMGYGHGWGHMNQYQGPGWMHGQGGWSMPMWQDRQSDEAAPRSYYGRNAYCWDNNYGGFSTEPQPENENTPEP